jgi:2'-5' RNA ligase
VRAVLTAALLLLLPAPPAPAAGLACPANAGSLLLFSSLPLGRTKFAEEWGKAQPELAREFPGLRFETPENLHVTLSFMGAGWKTEDVPEMERLSLAGPDLSSGPLKLKGALELFGPKKHVAALALGPVPEEWAARLMRERDAATEKGFRKRDAYDGVFKPHVSLAFAAKPEEQRAELDGFAAWMSKRARRFGGLELVLDSSIAPGFYLVVGQGADTRFTPLRSYCAETDYAFFAGLYQRLAAGETAAALEDRLPGLEARLRAAAAVSREHWTDSTTFDELAKQPILPPVVIDALLIPRETTAGVEHASAGAMHTYGYLFSQVRTAFGLKGKRWLESRLDERLGLPAGAFGPVPSRGEFTANVTAALLSLIGRPEAVPGAAKDLPDALTSGRVDQDVTWRKPDGKKVRMTVSTHLVPLKPLAGLETKDVALLIYEVKSGGRHRLVTAFPIEEGFAASIRATPPSTEAAFKPRFNLYVDPSWVVVSQRGSGFMRAGGKAR